MFAERLEWASPSSQTVRPALQCCAGASAASVWDSESSSESCKTVSALWVRGLRPLLSTAQHKVHTHLWKPSA